MESSLKKNWLEPVIDLAVQNVPILSTEQPQDKNYCKSDTFEDSKFRVGQSRLRIEVVSSVSL